MIKGFSLCGPFENSIHFFITMKSRGIWPDEFTFAPLLKACANLNDDKLAEGVHGEVIVLGFERYSSIRIGMLEFYVCCKKILDARKLFDEMSHKNVIVWNLMIRGYCTTNYLELGLHLFKQMDERTVSSWNTIISCLAAGGRDREALGLFHEMLDGGFEPDEATVVTVFPVCARLGEAGEGRQLHSYVKSSGLLADFAPVGNSLVDFYSKVGNLDTALSVFRDLPTRNVITWNTMITGFAFNGKGEFGVKLFDDMINEGLSPNYSTFVAVLSCCVHAGLLQKGRELFASISMKHGLEQKLEHYGCMVDLLGRGGCLKEAFYLIGSMPMRPNAAIWGALLSACRTHGDMELAECAVKELIKLEPWNSGNYVLLSNIHAEQSDWNKVEGARDLMKKNRVKRSAGQSAF